MATLRPLGGTSGSADDALDLVRCEGIHGVAFEPADRDRLAALADRAGGLAAVGTDAAAGVGERVGVVDLAHRLFEIVLPDGADVLRCIHVRRAGIVAHAALHAARGLDDGLLFVVTVDDLVEVVAARVRREFRPSPGEPGRPGRSRRVLFQPSPKALLCMPFGSGSTK